MIPTREGPDGPAVRDDEWAESEPLEDHESADAGAVGTPTRHLPGWTTPAVVVSVLAVAAVLRLWLAYGRLGGLDSDEAITGLMGLHIVRDGEFPAFYWGQQYGGTLDAYLVAPLLWLFGTSTVVLKIPVLLMGCGISYVTWRIALRLMPRDRALVTGLVSTVWPLGIVWKATKENGFYSATALLALCAWLLALQIDEDPDRRWRWATFGALTGVAWWTSPNVAYFAVPLALWLLLKGHGTRFVSIAVAGAGFVGGAIVWVVLNLGSGFASLDTPNWAGTSTYASRFRFFWTEGLPFAVGLRRPWDSAWAFGPTLGKVVYAGVLIVLLAIVVVRGIRLRADAIVFLTAPFLFAYFPGNWALSDGRYLFYVATILPFLVGHLWRAVVPKVALVALVLLTGTSFLRSASFLEGAVRPSTVPMSRALEERGFDLAVAEYWIAYQMAFESDERVVATPIDGSIRWEPWRRRSMREHVAYVFHRAGAEGDVNWLTARLDAQGIPWRQIDAGELTAILPARPMDHG